jgi:cytidine deaminase
MNENANAIFSQLKKLIVRAYAPYSEFKVAAATVDEAGKVHYGVNVENQSYPVGVCAEAAAIAALRAAGGLKIDRIYLLSDPNIQVVPCGACRQRIAELGSATTQIVTFAEDGKEISWTLQELFPHAFQFR